MKTLLLAMAALAAGPIDAENDASPPLPRWSRRPVALAIVDQGRTLLVANSRSGSLSIVDLATRRVVDEPRIGRGLAHLAPLGDGRHLLAVDRAGDEVVLIDVRERSSRVLGRVGVAPDPVRAIAIEGGAVVASTGSRRLTFLHLAPSKALTVAGRVELPFAPREMAAIPDGRHLVAADAFGGRLAIVDHRRRSVEAIRSIPAHNIRGMVVSPDGRSLVLAHQYLDRLARTTFDDVHWGLLIRNHLRVLPVEAVFSARDDPGLLVGGRLIDLGDVGYAAGDPGAIAFDNQGGLMVGLAGMDELAMAAAIGEGPRRVVVGREPVAVIVDPAGRFAYVADRLDETISVVEIATGERPSTIALGPTPEPSPADRGERLFTSARLSHDGWMSCQSCHADGQTIGLTCDTLGDQSYGAPKLIPSLLGVARTKPWTWIGAVDRLDEQVKKSIATTMHGTKRTDTEVADLTAYLASLEPPLPTPDDPAAIARGRAVFESRKCDQCHEPPSYTTPKVVDVGLIDEVGHRSFNPPSLRGAGRRDAFLHDGRARSLRDIFTREHHPRGLILPPEAINDLMAFLRSL